MGELRQWVREPECSGVSLRSYITHMQEQRAPVDNWVQVKRCDHVIAEGWDIASLQILFPSGLQPRITVVRRVSLFVDSLLFPIS